MDLCTGIGTLALAVAHNCRGARAFGSDLLQISVDNARLNASHLELADRVSFLCGDLFAPYDALDLENAVDVVLSAPPYISSAKVKTMPLEIAKFEPGAAFDGGPFGLSIFNELVATSPKYLRSGGYLAMEVGLGQGPFLKERILKNGNYRDVREVRDDDANVRVLVAQRC